VTGSRPPSPPSLVPGRIRAVVFDLDGTLVDSYAAIAASLNHARAAHGLPAVDAPEVRRAIGHGLEALIARYLGPERLEDGVLLFREEYSRVLARGTLPAPGALATLHELHRRGYSLALASNKPALFSERILGNLGILPLFRAVQGPERALAPKPHPAMIRACLSDLGVGPDAAVYVGDMVLDVETAAAAAVPVILVEGGSSDASELRRTGELVLSGISDLLPILPERVCGGP